MKDYKIDLSLENFEEDEDTYTFTAKTITNDFVCEPGLKRLSNDSPGKPVVWRHEHPVNPKFTKNHIYGRVLESHTDDGHFVSKYQGYKHTKDHIKVYNIIKERHEMGLPLSISLRYRQYGPDEAPVHFDVIEHSLTPTPACKECVILDIQNESDIMEKEEVEAKLKQIAKLEDELTLKTKKLEQMESKIVSLEKSIKEAEEVVETKDKELELEKLEKDELTKKVLSFSDKLNEQKQMIDKLNEGIKLKELDPLIGKLVELDGKDMKALYEMKAKNSLHKDEEFEETKKFFAERIKQRETEITRAIPKDLRDTALEAQRKDEELESDEEKKARDKGAFMNMPKKFFERDS